jgi:hypothetical protein
MWVTSRWIYGADSRKDPKLPNPDFHPPILFHHDTKTGTAYFTDEGGRELNPKKVPQYILDDIQDNPVHVVPQFAPPNIRQQHIDPETGQEFKPGQDVYRDSLQGVPLLNENRSNDLAAIQNKKLMEQNEMLMKRLEALETKKAAPKKRKRKPAKKKAAPATAQAE